MVEKGGERLGERNIERGKVALSVKGRERIPHTSAYLHILPHTSTYFHTISIYTRHIVSTSKPRTASIYIYI